jgi:hypothetical protein
MASYNSEDKLFEFPLLLNDPQLANEIAELRDKLAKINDCVDAGRLIGLREGLNGEWLGVFEKP